MISFVLCKHKSHFDFCQDQISSFFLLLKRLHLFKGLWCFCRDVWDPDAPSYISPSVLQRSSTAIYPAGCCFGFDSSPRQWTDNHIWQKLLCCLATQLLFWLLEWKQYFCCILQSNKFVTANPLSCFCFFHVTRSTQTQTQAFIQQQLYCNLWHRYNIILFALNNIFNSNMNILVNLHFIQHVPWRFVFTSGKL